jgi:hypothetical protein
MSQVVITVGFLSIVGAAIAASALGRSVLVIRVKSVQTSGRLIDKAPKGASKGDVLHVRDRLYNRAPQFGKPSGALVGSDQGTVTFLSASKAIAVGSANFPGGTVRFKGTILLTSNRSWPLRVVGGTGRYAHAMGITTEPASDADPANATNIYRLVFP